MSKVKVKNYPMVSPTPVVLAGAEVGGRPNYAAVGAFGVVCIEPVQAGLEPFIYLRHSSIFWEK